MNINGRMITSHKAKDFQIQIKSERRSFLRMSNKKLLVTYKYT